MKVLSKIATQVGFAGLVLLGFMLLFESYLSIPSWLQPFGRMHPLLLHLPIGILALLAILPLARKEMEVEAYTKVQALVLDLGLILTILTSICGLFLAQEEAYSPATLATHKWSAVALCILVYSLHAWKNLATRSPIGYRGLTLLTLGVLVATGHFGGAITHGEDYLWEPIKPAKEIDLAQASLFVAAVEPILVTKCNKCHNESKAKGKLIMSTRAGLLKGGESGPLWGGERPDSSLLLTRIHLPLKEEEHMPPEGKPQLTGQEMQLITEWIKDGADLDRPLIEYNPESAVAQLAQQLIGLSKEASAVTTYDFPAASASVIAELNTPFSSVYPISAKSPALAAKISVREYYQPVYLTNLRRIQDQLVYLNLTDLPVTNTDLIEIRNFSRLEKLVLNGTDIAGPNVESLGKLKALKSLALSNTATNASLAELLPELPNLEQVYVWNTEIDSSLVAQWSEKYPGIAFHLGFTPDPTEELKLNPPALVNDKMLLRAGERVVLKHNLPGAVIRYTLDGAEPDSLAAPIYQEPLAMDGITIIRAKAFREGWTASETVSFTIFQAGVKPKAVKLLQPTNGNYKGSGENTLVDTEKGIASNFRSPFWIGFRENPLEALFTFAEPIAIQEVVLSYAVNMGSYIMPPNQVEVWAGQDENSLQKIKTLKPQQPSTYGPTAVEAVSLSLEPTHAYRYYKLVAYPINRLPAWHAGAGDKAWVFSDEVLFFPADESTL